MKEKNDRFFINHCDLQTLHPVLLSGSLVKVEEKSECKDVFRQNDQIKSIFYKTVWAKTSSVEGVQFLH